FAERIGPLCGARWTEPRMRNGSAELRASRDYGFFHVAEAILAEEYLRANEKRRNAEGTARDGIVGVGDQPRLDVCLLRAREKPLGIKPGFGEGRAHDLPVIHFLRFNPHMMASRVYQPWQVVVQLCSHGHAHEE